MALAFILLGFVAIVVAIRNTYADLGNALATDLFSGQFWAWIIAIGVIVALGYIPYLRTPARWFFALIVIVFMLSNGTGFFSQLQNSSASTDTKQTSADKAQNPDLAGGLPINLLGSGGGGSDIAGTAKTALSGIETIASFISL